MRRRVNDTLSLPRHYEEVESLKNFCSRLANWSYASVLQTERECSIHSLGTKFSRLRWMSRQRLINARGRSPLQEGPIPSSTTNGPVF